MKFLLSIIAGMAAVPAILSSKTSDGVPVTEIITGIANDKLNADHSLINTLKVEHTSKLLEETWGERIEEPGVWEGFLTWEGPPCSLEHNEHFKKAASQIFSQYNFSHVPFAPFVNLTKSVHAPITETIFTSVKDGANETEFEAATQHALDVAGAAEGCLSGAYGHRVENFTEVVMVLGWASKEAHEKYAAGEPVKETTSRFLLVGNINRRFHVSYSNFLN